MALEHSGGAMKKRQAGLTLIELMVALVIGLLIVLGATQLFIIGKRSFDQVQILGIKQGAINFATDTLVQDIRRAKIGGIGLADGEVRIEFSGYYDESLCGADEEVSEKRYSLGPTDAAEPEGSHSLRVAVYCEDGARSSAPLAAGFTPDSLSIEADEDIDGKWVVSFRVDGSSLNEDAWSQAISFTAMSRAEAVVAINRREDEEG